MAYKDKDKQREANRERQRRYRTRRDTIGGHRPKGVTNQGITLPKNTDLGNTLTTTQTVGAVIPKLETPQVTEFTKTKFPENTRLPTHKRGKDIKCFADLPPDVQQTIDRMSTTEGKLDRTEKAKRTAIAINYQHLYEALGVLRTIYSSA